MTYTNYSGKLQGITCKGERFLEPVKGRPARLGLGNDEEVGEKWKLVYTSGGDVYDVRLFARN